MFIMEKKSKYTRKATEDWKKNISAVTPHPDTAAGHIPLCVNCSPICSTHTTLPGILPGPASVPAGSGAQHPGSAKPKLNQPCHLLPDLISSAAFWPLNAHFLFKILINSIFLITRVAHACYTNSNSREAEVKNEIPPSIIPLPRCTVMTSLVCIHLDLGIYLPLCGSFFHSFI